MKLGRAAPAIGFPYYRKGALIAAKYRSIEEKDFTQDVGGAHDFFGIDLVDFVEAFLGRCRRGWRRLRVGYLPGFDTRGEASGRGRAFLPLRVRDLGRPDAAGCLAPEIRILCAH